MHLLEANEALLYLVANISLLMSLLVEFTLAHKTRQGKVI